MCNVCTFVLYYDWRQKANESFTLYFQKCHHVCCKGIIYGRRLSSSFKSLSETDPSDLNMFDVDMLSILWNVSVSCHQRQLIDDR